MGSSPLSISDVLDVEYPGPPEWSGTGNALAVAIYEDDGNALAIATAEAESRRFRPDSGSVAEFAFSPVDDRLLVRTDEGTLLVLDGTDPDAAPKRLAGGPRTDTALAWAPDGTAVAYYRDGTPWIRDLESGTDRGFDVPERGPYLGDVRMFAWNAEGTRLAYRFAADDTKHLGVIDIPTGELVWRTRDPTFAASNPVWLADGRLLFERTGANGTLRQFVTADPSTDETTVLLEDRDEDDGIVSRGEPRVAPDGARFTVALPLDGWEHVYTVTPAGEATQLTAGSFEDKGLAGSSPRWIDDTRIAFASNRRDPGQRQIFMTDLDGDVTPIVESEGTNVHPRPSPDGSQLAYVHADQTSAPEVRVAPITGSGRMRRVTTSRTDDWPAAPVPVERVTYPGANDRTIHGYLLDPREAESVPDDADDLPAVVYVHGGPMRQMREGWHPSRSYGIAYAFHQYLAHRGVVGLFVNYRGGIGYGRAFRQALTGRRGEHEIEDIVRGAEYLARQEFVDADALGTWGLSYGGYTTLQVLGTHPDAFDLGANLAGLADLEQYRDWAYETKYPRVASGMELRLGGEPWEVPDAWANASPKTHMDHYEAPLYNFHGTDDDYVDFEQLDVVVDRLLAADAEFDTEYYPDESHVFEKRSVWRHTFRRIESAVREHLL